MTRKVVDTVQLGSLGSVLNVTILGVDVQEPLPLPESKYEFSVCKISVDVFLRRYSFLKLKVLAVTFVVTFGFVIYKAEIKLCIMN